MAKGGICDLFLAVVRSIKENGFSIHHNLAIAFGVTPWIVRQGATTGASLEAGFWRGQEDGPEFDSATEPEGQETL